MPSVGNSRRTTRSPGPAGGSRNLRRDRQGEFGEWGMPSECGGVDQPAVLQLVEEPPVEGVPFGRGNNRRCGAGRRRRQRGRGPAGSTRRRGRCGTGAPPRPPGPRDTGICTATRTSWRPPRLAALSPGVPGRAGGRTDIISNPRQTPDHVVPATVSVQSAAPVSGEVVAAPSGASWAASTGRPTAARQRGQPAGIEEHRQLRRAGTDEVTVRCPQDTPDRQLVGLLGAARQR